MDRTVTNWQDAVNFLLGVALFVSPFVLGFGSELTPALNAHIIGAIIAILALATMLAYRLWEEWVNAALGVWLVIAPWVLGFSSHTTAKTAHVLIGAATLVLALWAAREHDSGHLTISR